MTNIDPARVDPTGHPDATDTFVRPCHDCGATIRVDAGVEQPHEHHTPTQDDGSPLVFAWWQGYDARDAAPLTGRESARPATESDLGAENAQRDTGDADKAREAVFDRPTAARALDMVAQESWERGDIGKPGGVEPWVWLRARAAEYRINWQETPADDATAGEMTWEQCQALARSEVAHDTEHLRAEITNLKRTVDRITSQRDEWMAAWEQWEARTEAAEKRAAALEATLDRASRDTLNEARAYRILEAERDALRARLADAKATQ